MDPTDFSERLDVITSDDVILFILKFVYDIYVIDAWGLDIDCVLKLSFSFSLV